jgi:hypothetical protein
LDSTAEVWLTSGSVPQDVRIKNKAIPAILYDFFIKGQIEVISYLTKTPVISLQAKLIVEILLFAKSYYNLFI